MYRLMIKTHLKTGLKYLCMTCRDDWEKYTGSGVYWLNHLRKHGFDISTDLLLETDDYTEFVAVCLETSNELNVVLSEEYANLVPEAGYGSSTNGINNFTLFWQYACDQTKQQVYAKRADTLKDTIKARDPAESRNISNKISQARVAMFSRMTLDERRRCTESLRDGRRRFHANKHTPAYKDYIEKLKAAKKQQYANVGFEVLSTRNRSRRLNTPQDVKEARKKKIQEVYATGKHNHLFERYSIERQGIGNPSAKKILWKGQIYTKLQFEREIGKLEAPDIQHQFLVDETCGLLFDNAAKIYEPTTCPHCGAQTTNKPSSFKRWHMENCKYRRIHENS